MLFKFVTLAALAAATSVSAQASISAADMFSNLDRLRTLTRIATTVTNTDVYTDNPLINRNETIVIIDAIGTQGTLDQYQMAGTQCGTLQKRSAGSIAGRIVKRQSFTYNSEEQQNITTVYTALVDQSKNFTQACVEKHDAVVAHNAAHQMGAALQNTQAVLDAITTAIMPALTEQSDAMTAQKTALDSAYSNVVDLYVNGES